MKTSLYAQFRQVKVTKTGKEIFDRQATLKAIQDRLEYLRQEILTEKVSYAEIAELQDLKEFINPEDTLLLEWAGVPEFAEE